MQLYQSIVSALCNRPSAFVTLGNSSAAHAEERSIQHHNKWYSISQTDISDNRIPRFSEHALRSVTRTHPRKSDKSNVAKRSFEGSCCSPHNRPSASQRLSAGALDEM